MKKLPLGIQNFREIIQRKYLYIDKTQYIYNLFHDAKYYFLSRPRRFGKSLLIDTISEVFSGDKDLFRGLFIYDSDYAFEKHPVLRLDMSNISSETSQILKDSLAVALRKRVKGEELDIDSEIPSDIFKNLIESLYEKYKKRVVVLIDEYDKPILDHLANTEQAEANRRVLRGFYGILKSMDPYLEFVFISGVTKFTKTSLFSELNNLLDITLTQKYVNICGIVTDDLNKYFCDHMAHLSSLDDFRRFESLHDEILAWYDGYSWDGKSRVINPFSLLSFFVQERFASFWYASGTPAFLINLLKKRPESFLALKSLEIRERVLDTFDPARMEIEPMLFQTGYLTVKETRFRGAPISYLLTIPNREVEEALYMNIIAEFTEKGDTFAETAYWRIHESLETGDLQSMLDTLKALFASIPYQLHIDREAYYHSIFYAVMSVLGFDMDVEVSTSKGRLDAVLETDDKVYVMEFKYKDCKPDVKEQEQRILFEAALTEGMTQINDRGYCEKYKGKGKMVVQTVFAFLGRDNIEMRTETIGSSDRHKVN
ncbi:MAG: ATP-binding protein [Peptococcaceae bacterium]|nr:ATP-binding protein [Peptococcaceae bacterium]